MTARLTRDEIEAIRHRIATETVDQLAECFGVHRTTIEGWTRGMDRARARYGRIAINDQALLDMAGRLKQAEIARQLGLSRAAICTRLKKIARDGIRGHDEHFAQRRRGWGRSGRPAAAGGDHGSADNPSQERGGNDKA